MESNIPTVKAVLFDLDDTLVSREAAFAKYCAHLYHTHESIQQTHSEDEAVSLLLSWDFGMSWDFRNEGPRSKEDFFSDIINQWPGIFEDVAQAIEIFEKTIPKLLTLEPQTKQLLESLRRDGIPTGIVTNGPTKMQSAKIRNAGLDALVDAHVISDDAGVWKPEPAIFQQALSLINADPTTTIFVGDNPDADILGAKGMGMHTAWMHLNRQWPHAGQEPDFVLDNVWELRNIIPGL